MNTAFKQIKRRIKRTVIYRIGTSTRRRTEAQISADNSGKEIHKWESAGRPIPPPDAVKQKVVREYAERFRIKLLVETGTYLGDMINAVKDVFSVIHSIELDKALF